MIHPASHMTMTTYSRADGNSAVGAAAYRARTSFYDERRGRRYSDRSVAGLLSNEIIGWKGSAEELWNAAEASESRINARVARELRPALPAELPLPKQIELVRGMCLWLRDKYGVASQAAIHAPTFHNEKKGRQFWNLTSDQGLSDLQLQTLANPKLTNRNFHAHILMTTRRVDPESGSFGKKTRTLDDQRDGPKELKVIRAEWQKRCNATLEEVGSDARIDMRSYADMAAAGDAPVGLMTQDHLGPRRTARARKQLRDHDVDRTTAGQNRQAVREHNATLWTSWEILRDLQRQKAREEESERIAADRENERKRAAAGSRQQPLEVQTAKAAEDALASANHLDSSLTGTPLAQALAAAQSKDQAAWAQQAGPSETVDVETFERQVALSQAASEPPVLEISYMTVRQRDR